MNKNEYVISTKDKNITAVILLYGGIIKDFFVKHPNGKTYNIVLGYKNEDDYKKDKDTRMGAFVGRHVGRIKDAEFTLNSKKYTLTKNDHNAHLHGNLNSVMFSVKEHTDDSITLTYLSKDGEDGFPGNLEITLTYQFIGNDFFIRTTAKCDEDTLFSPTNHTYFNLEETDTIYDSYLYVQPPHVFEIDEELCQTGKIIDIEKTPLDFESKGQCDIIRKALDDSFNQTKWAKGIDHTYKFNKAALKDTYAVLRSDNMELTVYSSEPCLHVYSGGSLGKCDILDRNGRHFKDGGGICFEPERISYDSQYPILKKGEKFTSSTVWSIGLKGYLQLGVN